MQKTFVAHICSTECSNYFKTNKTSEHEKLALLAFRCSLARWVLWRFCVKRVRRTKWIRLSIDNKHGKINCSAHLELRAYFAYSNPYQTWVNKLQLGKLCMGTEHQRIQHCPSLVTLLHMPLSNSPVTNVWRTPRLVLADHLCEHKYFK